MLPLSLLTLNLVAAPPSRALTLAANGQSPYVIVLCEDPLPAERTAAGELQEHLKLVTGAELPIVDEGSAGTRMRAIVVGPGKLLAKVCPDVDLAALKHDGIVMRTVGDAIYLAGGRPRGTLYAVYTFLEDVVGVRWWSATESFVPKKPTLEIPELNTVYVPKLQYREAFYRGAFDGVFAVRLKTNGNFERIPEEYGGHYRLLGWCHTFYQLLPPDKYFAQHPEWYSEIDGKRTAEGAQLCLTNDEMRAEFTRQALEWLRKDPTAGMISIAQNDCGGNCQCPKCKAVEEAEGSPSGLIIRFVNQVAEDIEQEFPGTLVETLAYSYSRKAPLHAKPRENVVVRLCSIECNFAEPLGAGPTNATFKADIDAWAKIAPHLYIWDYVTNFADYILPHPNLRVLAPNVRLFVDHNAIGLFEQGDAGCSCSDFPELRAWLLAHLMWDPSRDERALVREFLAGYYGKAADPLQRYLDLTCDAVEREGAYLRCFMTDTADWLKLDDVNRTTELFRQAEQAVAGDEVLTKRVRRARMPLDHVWLMRYYALRRQAKGEGKPFLGPEDPVAAIEAFAEAAHEFDIGNLSEGMGFAQYEPTLRARFRPPAPPPDVCKALPADQWIDIQDNEFLLYNLGTWVTTADDPAASDGKAARMPGGHNQWATQYPISPDFDQATPWHCYIVARCDARAKEGAAFTLGIYDANAKAGVAQQTETLQQAGDGQYRTYDLGVHQLKPGMYFWVAPPGNAELVDAVYVDRIFCVKGE